MDMPISTEYPTLQAADPTRPSLANLPLEIVLEILETIFKREQIITVDVYCPEIEYPAYDVEGDENNLRAKVILRAPPLNTTAATCRLFRWVYRKSRPTVWSPRLHLGPPYHVDLARDIFHVRFHSLTEHSRFGSQSYLTPLRGFLDGVQRVSTCLNYLFLVGVGWFLSLDSTAKELIILVPVSRLESNVLELSPLLVPLRAEDKIVGQCYQGVKTWPEFKTSTEEYQRLRAQSLDGEVCPTFELQGYLVDERRLNDPVGAFGTRTRFRPAGGPKEDFSLLRAGL
jgi:hypothetical protein